MRQTLEAHGRIDVLVDNAGIFMRGNLRSTTLADYRRVIDINQIGVFLGMQAVAPAMIEQKAGSIVNISSTAGFVGTAGAIRVRRVQMGRERDDESRGARTREARRARELDPPRHDRHADDEELTDGDKQRFQRIERTVPMGRVAAPEEVARLALYLASDDSSYSTGTEFIVDGGVTAV